MYPAVIVNLFTRLSFVHSHNVTSRVNNDYFLPRVRLDECKKFITFQGVNICFKIDINTRLCNNMHKFKYCFITMLLSRYDY